MRRLLAPALALIASLTAPPAAGQELGRLFFTPEQRSTLDARRKARIPDKPAEAAVESPVMRVDGIVSRGGGKSTVWVNGQPIAEGSQQEGMRIYPRPTDSGRVTVELGEADTQVDLKAGQSFDRATGEVRDSLEGGEVRVNPRAAPRPAR